MKNRDMPVIILGTGGHSKVIVDMLIKSEIEILGFVTLDKQLGDSFCGYKVLGDDSAIANFLPNDVALVNGIGALPQQKHRWMVATKMRDMGYSFMTIVHSSAIIASSVKLGEGVQVMAGSVIQPDVYVGNDSIINTGVLIDHDCKIARNCHLAPGVVCSGNVNIGEGTHIGTGVSIIQNISIGKESVVAAGSVVYKNVANKFTFVQYRKEIILNYD